MSVFICILVRMYAFLNLSSMHACVRRGVCTARLVDLKRPSIFISLCGLLSFAFRFQMFRPAWPAASNSNVCFRFFNGDRCSALSAGSLLRLCRGLHAPLARCVSSFLLGCGGFAEAPWRPCPHCNHPCVRCAEVYKKSQVVVQAIAESLLRLRLC